MAPEKNDGTPAEQAARDDAQQAGRGDDFKVIKILPRNLTARADYLVEGNPATSRPESGVDISFPGLELDQRNLDQRFFPGLYFEFQRDDGAILAKLELKEGQQTCGLTDADLSPARPLFLLGLYGRSKVGEQSPAFVSFDRKRGAEVWRRVHDLLPGRVAIIFGPSVNIAFAPSKPVFDERIKELAAAYGAEKDVDKFVVHRDGAGLLRYAIFSADRAAYLDDNGVIDPETYPPGELTKTLCAPWIYDFRDCVCFYWASNKPDIADAGERNLLNFLRDRSGDEPPKPTADYEEWIGQRMGYAQLTSGGWKQLPVVLDDRERPVGEPPVFKAERQTDMATGGFAALGAVFSPQEIVSELQYLATVEHALIVEYLYALYSLNAPAALPEGQEPEDDAAILFSVAGDLLSVATDEMRHFLWVNQLLRLFNCPSPVTDRAKVIGLTPRKGSERKRIPDFRYLNLHFGLRPLTKEVLGEFIQIEENSKAFGAPAKRFGMYVHILASLLNRQAEIPNAGSIIRIVKLLIDEGDDHRAVFESIRDRLKAVKGPRLREPPYDAVEVAEPERHLLDVADEYYRQILELIHVSYRLGDRAGGALISEAVKFMHNLDEIGHELARKKIGLRFSLPNLKGFQKVIERQGPEEVLRECEQRINSKLAEVSKTGDSGPRQMAERHLAASKDVHKKMRRVLQGCY